MRSCSETTGDVRDIYPDKRQVTLKGVVKDTTYELEKDGTVWVNGRLGQLKDLRDGDRVRITYQVRGDRNVATDIADFGKK